MRSSHPAWFVRRGEKLYLFPAGWPPGGCGGAILFGGVTRVLPGNGFRGSESTIVDGVQIDWEQGDFFALPPWSWHEHVNRSGAEEAVLFSTTDAPVIEAVNLYCEEPYEERDGYQKVTSTYGG